MSGRDKARLDYVRLCELAGAKTVVATLWSVPAPETVDLMTGFIDNFLRKPKGAALADSEVTVLRLWAI
jgi:CHAT domain-containing protein